MTCYQRSVSRDGEIEAIVERARQARKRAPRWLWIASLAVAAICVIGFAAALLGERDPAASRGPPGNRLEPSTRSAGGPVSDGGLGIGLVVGAGAGIVIGFVIGRQRRTHSSRNSP